MLLGVKQNEKSDSIQRMAERGRKSYGLYWCIGVTNDKENIILLKTWNGSDITKLIKLEKPLLTIKAEPTTDDDTPAEVTFANWLNDCMHTFRKRWINTWPCINYCLHNKAKEDIPHNKAQHIIRFLVVNFDKKLYSIEEGIKDAVIFGMNDSMLKEKALVVDPDLEKLTQWVLAREAGNEDAHHLKGSNIRRLDF